MIDDKKFVEKQVNRMSQLPGFPRETEAKRELAFALQVFSTEGHARAFVDDWIAHESVCPLPAAIRKLANEQIDRENLDWVEAKKCPDCSGSGFRMEKRKSRPLPGMQFRDYDCAVPCDHRGVA